LFEEPAFRPDATSEGEHAQARAREKGMGYHEHTIIGPRLVVIRTTCILWPGCFDRCRLQELNRAMERVVREHGTSRSTHVDRRGRRVLKPRTIKAARARSSSLQRGRLDEAASEPGGDFKMGAIEERTPRTSVRKIMMPATLEPKASNGGREWADQAARPISRDDSEQINVELIPPSCSGPYSTGEDGCPRSVVTSHCRTRAPRNRLRVELLGNRRNRLRGPARSNVKST